MVVSSKSIMLVKKSRVYLVLFSIIRLEDVAAIIKSIGRWSTCQPYWSSQA